MPFIRPLLREEVSILKSDTLKVLSITHWPGFLKVPSVLSSIEPGRTAVLLQRHTKTQQHHYSQTCTTQEESYSSIVPSLAIIVGLRVEARDSLFAC